MKKNKGFTLIELLAIIVILAIIAVITVPIILNIIENSRMGAAQDSAYGYKDAVNKWYVSKLQEDNNLKLNGTYTVTNGNLGNNEILLSGEKPSSGTLTYSNNVLQSGCLTIGDYKVTFTNGEVSSTEKGVCSTSLVCGSNQHISTSVEYYLEGEDINTCTVQFITSFEEIEGRESSNEEKVKVENFCKGQEVMYGTTFSDLVHTNIQDGAQLSELDSQLGVSIKSRNIQVCIDNSEESGDKIVYYTVGSARETQVNNSWNYYIKETTSSGVVTNQLCIVTENDTICLNANDKTNTLAAVSSYNCQEGHSCRIGKDEDLSIHNDGSLSYGFFGEDTSSYCELNKDGTAECVSGY